MDVSKTNQEAHILKVFDSLGLYSQAQVSGEKVTEDAAAVTKANSDPSKDSASVEGFKRVKDMVASAPEPSSRAEMISNLKRAIKASEYNPTGKQIASAFSDEAIKELLV